MGLGYEIPANQLGGSKILWVFAGYGLSQVWVKTGSTVVLIGINSLSLFGESKLRARLALAVARGMSSSLDSLGLPQ